jgi:hypothetical protein
MSMFDYGAEAGLFSSKQPGKGMKARQTTIEYRRFAKASEAIRFAVEEIPPHLLQSCSLEVAEATYVGAAIRGLYDHSEFPLPRRDEATKK